VHNNNLTNVGYQKMTKNRDDFEELCENIVGTVKVLQAKISRHDVTATTSLQQLCGDLEQYVDCAAIHHFIHLIGSAC
jgi:hypothetical protein